MVTNLLYLGLSVQLSELFSANLLELICKSRVKFVSNFHYKDCTEYIEETMILL